MNSSCGFRFIKAVTLGHILLAAKCPLRNLLPKDLDLVEVTEGEEEDDDDGELATTTSSAG
jgi:hypothetical protein